MVSPTPETENSEVKLSSDFKGKLSICVCVCVCVYTYIDTYLHALPMLPDPE